MTFRLMEGRFELGFAMESRISIRAVTLILGITVMASCSKMEEQQSVSVPAEISSVSADQIQGASDSSTAQVELPFQDATGRAIILMAGQKLESAYTSTFSGAVEAGSIQVGNFGGSADGNVQLQVCVESRCSLGSTPLSGSLDNKQMKFSLEKPVSVRFGDVLTLKITRTDGEKPAAVWVYKSAEGSARTSLDGTALDSETPKLKISYKKPEITDG